MLKNSADGSRPDRSKGMATGNLPEPKWGSRACQSWRTQRGMTDRGEPARTGSRSPTTGPAGAGLVGAAERSSNPAEQPASAALFRHSPAAGLGAADPGAVALAHHGDRDLHSGDGVAVRRPAPLQWPRPAGGQLRPGVVFTIAYWPVLGVPSTGCAPSTWQCPGQEPARRSTIC
jgi:hypothetical protein